jgi:predicted lipoprotein with Yx(FWY)xxD motif
MAFKGKPLYTWAKDTKARGDKTGDGVNNIWHVAKGN